MPEYMNAREIARTAQRQVQGRHPSVPSIFNGLRHQGKETSQVPTEFGRIGWVNRSAETGEDDDWLSLPKHIAEKWIANLVAHWTAVYTESRARRAEKAKVRRLFPKRMEYLRRVGYEQMDKEWWQGRRADQNYTPDVARRRDVDNQILAKYRSRKDEFPGGEVTEVAPPPMGGNGPKTDGEVIDVPFRRTSKFWARADGTLPDYFQRPRNRPKITVALHRQEAKAWGDDALDGGRQIINGVMLQWKRHPRGHYSAMLTREGIAKLTGIPIWELP